MEILVAAAIPSLEDYRHLESDSDRAILFSFFAALRFRPVVLVRALAGLTRSGSFCPPVSRFHSSYVSAEIFPSTNNCANFRRCA